MSDSEGFIYVAEGIDLAQLAYIKKLKNDLRGRIKEFIIEYPNAQYFEGEKPWNIQCDIALPNATQNELDGEDAKKLIANGCFCVAEGANMPCTPEAVHEFNSAKVFYAPGKAANAGGVAVSGLEMAQNSLRYNWTRDKVDGKLKEIMLEIHNICVKYGTEEDGHVNYEKGANIGGFVKVADAMIAQGVV